MTTRGRRQATTAAVFGSLLLGAPLLGACGGDDEEAGSDGQALFEGTFGCASCHSTGDDDGIGPPLGDLFGSEVQLDDGTTVVADRDYIEESIVDPNAKVVEGYPANMPQLSPTPEQLADLVDYVVSLSDAGAEGGSGEGAGAPGAGGSGS